MMSAPHSPLPQETVESLRAHAAWLQTELSKERAHVLELERERDQLRAAYEAVRLELELLKRRLFVAKAERVDTKALEKEFAGKQAELDALHKKLQQEAAAGGKRPPCPPKPAQRPRPSGRRDLSQVALPEEHIEITDPVMEDKVKSGLAERIGFERSYKLAWQRGGHRRLVLSRVKYRTPGQTPQTTTLETAPVPKETLPRCLAAPSLLAHIAVDKYCDGLPLFRIEDRFARDGVKVDRGTMSRWLEDLGATLGATVIAAARKEALSTAFCIATDATGVLVQPIATGKRQPCRRGHYFVQIADRDHVFFEYTAKETSATVGQMFRGFSGYVLADAKSVYDLLFLPPHLRNKLSEEEDDLGVRNEVGCWAHARRKFWEAAIAKSAEAREALLRIGRFFDLDEQWRDLSPAQRKGLRDVWLRPEVEAFFAWAGPAYEQVRHQRGLLRRAFGYALRQKSALMRFFDDGRLPLTNNGSERQLRTIAVGRKAWLFVGSDDHAAAAGHILSLIASARLHVLDPEAYLRDLVRVLPYWPKDRHLELVPRYWASTRARLDPVQLRAELGPLTLPAPLSSTAQQQATSH